MHPFESFSHEKGALVDKVLSVEQSVELRGTARGTDDPRALRTSTGSSLTVESSVAVERHHQPRYPALCSWLILPAGGLPQENCQVLRRISA